MKSFTYLDSFLEPLVPFLAPPDVTDVYVNRPHEVWTETLGGETHRYECPALSEAVLMRLARCSQPAFRMEHGYK